MEIIRHTAAFKSTVRRCQARYLEASVDGFLHDIKPASGDAAAGRHHQGVGADQDDARNAVGREPLESVLEGACGRHQPHFFLDPSGIKTRYCALERPLLQCRHHATRSGFQVDHRLGRTAL